MDDPRASDTAIEFERLPLADTCRRIDFDFVTIQAMSPPHGALLVVAGIKDWLNLTVVLRPRCYQTPPAFWGIEVVGALPGHGVPGAVDFHVVLPLQGVCGTEGIEVIGATKSERRLFAGDASMTGRSTAL